METDPQVWISALHDSQQQLLKTTQSLGGAELHQQSYATEWSIADVLSHLGSQAQMFHLFLNAGLSGEPAPGRDDLPPIWESWNSRAPEAQAADSLRVNSEFLQRLDRTDTADQRRFELSLFGRNLDWAGLAQMRLSEQTIHTWDIGVALDAQARVGSSAVDLLVDTLPELAARTGKAGPERLRIGLATTRFRAALQPRGRR